MNERHAAWLMWRAEEAMGPDNVSVDAMQAGWCALMALRWLAIGDVTGGYRFMGRAYAALMDGVAK